MLSGFAGDAADADLTRPADALGEECAAVGGDHGIIPLRTFGDPDQLLATARLLVGAGSGYITGSVFTIDDHVACVEVSA